MGDQINIDNIDEIINEIQNQKKPTPTRKKIIFLSFAIIFLLIISTLTFESISIAGLSNLSSTIPIQALSGLSLTQIDNNLNFLFNVVNDLLTLVGIFALLDLLENSNIKIIQNIIKNFDIIRNFEIRGYFEILAGVTLIILGILNYNNHLIPLIYSIVPLLIAYGLILIVSGTRHFINKIINKS